MVAAAGPGGFNDADMLPIGATFTMNGSGKKVPVVAFTLDQVRFLLIFACFARYSGLCFD